MESILPAHYAHAFKPADIRGTYPEEINETLAFRVMAAFVRQNRYREVVVGRDMRTSSPSLAAACIEGARAAGANVIDLGLVATPQLYFASGSLGLPGVMVTASHSPAVYNGLKLVHPGAVPLTATTGLTAIKRAVASLPVVSQKLGRVRSKNLDQAYIRHVLKGMKKSRYKNVRVATDVGNGMAHDIVPLLRQHLPVTFATIFNTLDGTFPNRDSDPNLKENQRALDTKLDHGTYDFGISFDGDADRIAFLDEAGNYVNSAAIGALIAARILAREPGATFATTNLNSRIYEETIRANGGKVVMAKTGHTFVKEVMRKRGAVFGCEYSGHFFFRDFFYTDSVVLTFREVLDAYAEEKARGGTFKSLIEPYLRYKQTEDVVVLVKDKALVMNKMAAFVENLKPKRTKKFDGLFVDFGTVWGAIKPSVTEPGVKLMFESTRRTDAEAVQRSLLRYLRSIKNETA